MPEKSLSNLRGRAAGLTLALVLAATALPGVAAPEAAWQTAELWGADVRSLAIDPRQPDTVLAGTSAGHVYLSRDGGRRWAPAGAPLPLPGWVVGTLLFDPNRPERLWAGLWGIWGGGMVVYSEDLGKSWRNPHPVHEEEQIYALALVPGQPGRLYASTRTGVYLSTDDGERWRHITAAYPQIHNVSSLYVDALRPRTVIAGTWRRAYRSDDGGATWRGIFTGMVEDSELFTIQPVPGRPGELWASTCGWVYQTKNLGENWTRFKEGFQNRRTPSFLALASGRLVAGTVGGAHISDDQGKTWRRVTDPALSVLAIAAHPARPGRVILGTEGTGIWVSEDGGETYGDSTRGLTNVRVMALARAGDRLFAAVNHAGPGSGVYASLDGGRTFPGRPIVLPTVLALAADGGRVWAATEAGLYERNALGWRRVAELGQGRVDQVEAAGGRVVAASGGKIFELRPQGSTRFTEVPYHHGPPRSAALVASGLWVSDAKGLYRLGDGTNHAVAAPFAGGALAPAGDGVLLTGKKGVWTRAGLASAWRELSPRPARALATGDARFPALLVESDGARLVEAGSGRLVPVELPVLPRDVAAALIAGDRLLLGTSGHGLLGAPLPGAP
ncbi:MAG TPA: hypothetical protein VFE44_01515 [Thermoanaerobaculia bacterium]|nr:hypothetical protein [Thermoanaerobaculia bacterium]